MPITDDASGTINIDLKDPAVQKIFDLQDRQLTDSLLVLLQNDNPNYRFLATMAFSSVKDPNAVGPLSGLLFDDYISIRRAAAYALGQIGAEEATVPLIEGFEPSDTTGLYGSSNAAILEAVGKTGTLKELRQISTTSTYRPTDTLLLLGQARSIYRFALRGITHPDGTNRMLTLVKDEVYPQDVRLMASNNLYRAAGINLRDQGQDLAQLIFKEEDPRIRMTLAIALGKAGGPEALAALQQRFRMETAYRVKCNNLRAL
ncbi:MAG: HEAT repeat domain-containing protein, partial [Saprospiraceae bacterium]|nr:HEAT repeat domain-containing protein [Saprospiraceae bacterium]